MRQAGRQRLVVKAGPPVTEKPRPRVLVLGFHEDTDLVERLRARVPTVHAPQHGGEVDFDEWDCVVTRSSWTSFKATEAVEDGYGREAVPGSYIWSQDLPPHVSIVYAVSTSTYRLPEFSPVDFWPPRGEAVDAPEAAIIVQHDVQGQHVAMAQGLPGRLTELVRRNLLPIAERRTRHTIFDLRGRESIQIDPEHPLTLTPLLYGPRDVYLAAMYDRSEEASVWLLPEDIGDLLPWVLAALREWHDIYPDRFPSLPDWPNDERFRTRQESMLHDGRDTVLAEAQRLVEQYMEEERKINDRLRQADVEGAAFERALLTEQGEPLASAVHKALEALGFRVRDMDAERDGQPKKEDFRLTDPDADGWVAIAEAKGFLKGVKETGILSLERWASAYIFETRQQPSARWYIANQHLREDPDTRPAPFASRPDIIELLADTGSLLLDTYAVFRLVRAVQDEEALAAPIRARLRDRVGRLSLEEANALLTEARNEQA